MFVAVICSPMLLWAQAAGGRFDGNWTTTMACDASAHMPAYKWKFLSTIANSAFHGQHGEEGGPGYMVIDGPVNADGSGEAACQRHSAGRKSRPRHPAQRQ